MWDYESTLNGKDNKITSKYDLLSILRWIFDRFLKVDIF